MSPESKTIAELQSRLDGFPRASLTTLPTPIHQLPRLTAALEGPEIWVKREDMTGLEGGGNKTRKLEFVIGDAIDSGADTLVTVGAIQSNSTRQVASAAAKLGMAATLLHNAWAPDAGPHYRRVGNPLLSSLVGATIYFDDHERPIEDEGSLEALVATLNEQGKSAYLIPGGASDHPRGGMGYAACAIEICLQEAARELEFDYIIHCTGSSGTQAGLLAGLLALGRRLPVIGVADDGETEIKKARVLRLANLTLAELGCSERLPPAYVRVIASDPGNYGVPSAEVLETIRLVATTEGMIVDPVYEARSMLGLMQLIKAGTLTREHRVLFLHLGGGPAIHGYADLLWDGSMKPWPPAASSALQD